MIEVQACRSLDAEYYREGTRDLIRRLVPLELFDAASDGEPSARVRFCDTLPLIQISEISTAPCSLSIALLCKSRRNASQFFYEMISRWLLPHRKLDIELFFSSDTRVPHLCDDLLSISEISVRIQTDSDLQEVRQNLKQIETEIRLGSVSEYHARRILEFKGLSNEAKTAMIQEKIGSLIQGRSQEDDCGIFSQMQQFLVSCKDDFKKARDYHHISRIISNLYSICKLLKQSISVLPQNRHVMLKFLKTRLASTGMAEGRPVLGILASLNLLREHEIFDQRHLADAISKQIDGVRVVEGSFFVDRSRDSAIQTIYIEIEKESGADFSHEEIQRLKRYLPEDLKAHIEQLTHPVFMPRNEEEVLRNIMVLSRQLRYVTDMPQLIISFDAQQGGELLFTLIVLRVLGDKQQPMSSLLCCKSEEFSIAAERVRILSSLGRKHHKEAGVFRARLKSDLFLREDRSVDLYQARQYILGRLAASLGEVRDYNGGMIEKQNEVLEHLKRALGRAAKHHGLLLEKFFFSLAPVELRSAMDVESLKHLFLLLVRSQKKDWGFRKRSLNGYLKKDSKRAFAVIPSADPSLRESVRIALEPLGILPTQFISFSIEIHETPVSGFLLQSDRALHQICFLQAVQKGLQQN